MPPMEDLAPAATATLSGRSPLEFEPFFLEHHAALFRALWLVTRNHHEAEEIMQDAFLRMLERWSAVQAAGNPEGYLYRTAMNGYRSRLRPAAAALGKPIGHCPVADALGDVKG